MAKPRQLTVGDYMTADPITLEPEDSLMRALEVMRLRGVRRIPVVLGGMLVGLVVEGDLKREEPGTPISRIMVQNPVTATAAQPLVEAAEILHSTKYGALPVVEEGRVIGILTDNDMLRALIDLLRRA